MFHVEHSFRFCCWAGPWPRRTAILAAGLWHGSCSDLCATWGWHASRSLQPHAVESLASVARLACHRATSHIPGHTSLREGVVCGSLVLLRTESVFPVAELAGVPARSLATSAT